MDFDQPLDLNILTEKNPMTSLKNFVSSCSLNDEERGYFKDEFLSSTHSLLDGVNHTFCSVGDGFDLYSSLSYDLYKNIFIKCFSVQDEWKENDVEGLFHDIVFVVEGKRVPAHRMIVCARSSYFRALFLNEMKEEKPDLVDIEDCSYEVFKSVICWMYTDQLQVPEKESYDVLENSIVWKLWRAATYFCLEGLVKLIENHIMNNIININNICSFWDTVLQINAFSLQYYCSLYFKQHINEIIATKTFVSLSKEKISRLFSEKLGICAVPIQIKALALTKWFATNSPRQLKRKLESMDNFNLSPLKKRKVDREN